MEQISNFFGTILKFFYDISGEYYLAIIFFTIVTKLILLPFTFSQMKSQAAMKRVQPKIDAINKKYKGNPQKQNELLQRLYKENNVNPLAGCLPLLVQFPVIMAMYNVVRDPVKFVFKSQEVYDAIQKGFFWINSLSNVDAIPIALGGKTIGLPGILPILSAISTYYSIRMTTAKASNSSENQNEMMKSMNSSMQVMMPMMMLFFGITLPSGLVLYWVVGTIVQIIQQYFIGKYEEKHFNENKTKSVKN